MGQPMAGKLVWRASDTAELYFEDVFVPDENMLGKQGDGSRQMLSTLDRGKIGIAAIGIGCAQGAYEKALAYLQLSIDRLRAGRHAHENRNRPHVSPQSLLDSQPE